VVESASTLASILPEIIDRSTTLYSVGVVLGSSSSIVGEGVNVLVALGRCGVTVGVDVGSDVLVGVGVNVGVGVLVGVGVGVGVFVGVGVGVGT
jgi:hypothetical protein